LPSKRSNRNFLDLVRHIFSGIFDFGCGWIRNLVMFCVSVRTLSSKVQQLQAILIIEMIKQIGNLGQKQSLVCFLSKGTITTLIAMWQQIPGIIQSLDRFVGKFTNEGLHESPPLVSSASSQFSVFLLACLTKALLVPQICINIKGVPLRRNVKWLDCIECWFGSWYVQFSTKINKKLWKCLGQKSAIAIVSHLVTVYQSIGITGTAALATYIFYESYSTVGK
jgi:hypothetical protein